MHDITLGLPTGPTVIFGHGWGRDHRDFIPAAESLTRFVRSHLIDFPGFGEAARPEATWGSADYADDVAKYIKRSARSPVIWVGHSFGARIGLQLAVRHPQLVKGIILVGGAGIRPQRSVASKWRSRMRQWQFKMLRSRARTDAERDTLERRFGSPDYIASGKLGIRDIFVKVVNEDQSESLRSIRAPTRFIYGSADTETTPALGKRMSELAPGSIFEEIPEFDHHTILSRGYHILARRIREFGEITS